MDKKIHIWVLAAILIIGLALRVTGIEWGLPTKTETLHTFHPDETIILTALKEMQPSKLDFNPHHFMVGNTHFYVSALVLKACSALKIIKLSSEKDFYRDDFREMDKIFIAGRIMSMTFALLTLLLVFLIGKEVYSEETGLWGALLMSIMPIHVIDSHYMTFDTPVTFWFTLTLFLSLKIYGSPRIKWYVLAGITSAMACGTKYYGGVSIFFPVCAHLIRDAGAGKKFVFDKRIWYAAAALLVTFFATNPYLLIVPKEAAGQIRDMLGLASTVKTSPDIIKDNSFFFFYPKLATFDLGIPLAAASLAGFIMQFFRMNKKVFLMIFAFFIFYVPMSLFYIKMEHYLLPVMPILALFAASIILFRKGLLLRLAIGAVAVYTFFYSSGYVNIMAKKDTHLQATEWIRRNIPAGARVGAIDFYFYTPPALYSYMHLMPENKDAVDYKITLTGYDEEKLKKERPQYFVITDFEYCEDYQAFWRRGDVPAKERFLDSLMNGGMYTEIRAFVEYPSAFGLRLDPRRPPWHIRFVKPEVKILKIKDAGS